MIVESGSGLCLSSFRSQEKVITKNTIHPKGAPAIRVTLPRLTIIIPVPYVTSTYTLTDSSAPLYPGRHETEST
jgi:hypothetical protein